MNTKLPSLSVIIPVYMEAKNIRGAVDGAIRAVENAGIEKYELIIIDCLRRDGSHDRTPEIADELASSNPRIRVIHNNYVNLGYKYFQGVHAARYDYVTLIPGDNENATDSITETLKRIGEADIIIPYPVNTEVRPLMRRIFSRTYTLGNNFIFGLNLRYYNGLSVYRKDLFKRLPQWTDSFAYAAEILVLLLKSGASYIEIPIQLQKRASGKTAAFEIKNIITVMNTIFSLFWRVNIKKEKIKTV